MSPRIILDTQLIVLLAVGVTSADIIPKHKNLTEFTCEDFALLLMLLGPDPDLLLLPNTVSEAANLLRHHREPERGRIMEKFREIVGRNPERYIHSRLVTQQPEYLRLGVTDAAILGIFMPGEEILTADAALYIAAMRRGLSATNFHHKREEFGIV